MALTTLQRNQYNGGISLPDLETYYWVEHLTPINEWLHVPANHPTYKLERDTLGNHSCLYYLYGGPGRGRLLPATQTTLRAWDRATKIMGWTHKPTKQTPLWCCNWLKELHKLKGFRAWDAIGISMVGDVVAKGALKPFKELASEFGLHASQLFKYIQLRHAWTRESWPTTPLAEYAPLEGRLLQERIPHKGVSLTYKTINTNIPDKLGRLREAWERDVGEMENIDWETVLMHHREVSIKSRLRLIQYKILHRVYYDRVRLHKVGKATDPTCLRCRHSKGDFYHIIWDCPVIQIFWRHILDELSTIVETPLPLDPKLVLLGIAIDVDLGRPLLIFILLALVVAKRDVARAWGNATPPKLVEWQRGMDLYMAAERVTYKARGCPKTFRRIWGNWRRHHGLDGGLDPD